MPSEFKITPFKVISALLLLAWAVAMILYFAAPTAQSRPAAAAKSPVATPSAAPSEAPDITEPMPEDMADEATDAPEAPGSEHQSFGAGEDPSPLDDASGDDPNPET